MRIFKEIELVNIIITAEIIDKKNYIKYYDIPMS